MFKRSSVWRGLTLVFSLLLAISLMAGSILETYRTSVDAFFNTRSQLTVTEVDETGEAWSYVSKFKTAKEAFEGLKEFAIRESQETVALLKNDGNALPLSKDAKITMLGVRSYAPVYGSSGGSITDGNATVQIFDCFTERGFQLNPSVQAAYAKYFADKTWTKPRFGGGIKQLAAVGPNGEIIMDYSIHDAIEAGFDKIVFIIRHDIEEAFKEAIGDRIEKICAGLGVEIDYAFQALENVPEGFSVPEGRSKPWGTGQAVLACKGIIKEPFAVINADDYYGKEAFVQLHDFLQGYTPDKPGDLAMAGFVLKNTLSDNGAVTRGICQMNDAHYLTGVLETSGIEKTADGAAAGGKSIDIDSLVSMNMWALTPEFVDLLESGFVEFFEKAAPANPLKAEYLLPIYIDELLHADKVSVKVLPTHDKWFGVTYAEDKQTVIDSFARLVADGVYKKDLFSDLKK